MVKTNDGRLTSKIGGYECILKIMKKYGLDWDDMIKVLNEDNAYSSGYYIYTLDDEFYSLFTDKRQLAEAIWRSGEYFNPFDEYAVFVWDFTRIETYGSAREAFEDNCDCLDEDKDVLKTFLEALSDRYDIDVDEYIKEYATY